MSNWWRSFFPSGKKQIRQTARQRYFMGAVMDRTTEDFPTSGGVIDSDLMNALPAIRNRARHLVKNFGLGSKFIKMLRYNVVGHEGFLLQNKAFDLRKEIDPKTNSERWVKVFDTTANSIIEEGWKLWSGEKSCNTQNRYNLRKMQNILISAVFTDGDVFIVKRKGFKKNRHNFALQVITNDYIDHMQNGELANGNVVRMGVEFDSEDSPVAYHFIKQGKYNAVYSTMPVTGEKVRIPAEDVIHLYYPDFALQSRGISWLAPVILDFHSLAKYQEASLQNARASQKMGWYERDPGAEDYPGDEVDPNTDQFMEQVIPGEIFIAPPGYKFNGFDPKFPTEQYTPFVKTVLRSIGSGVGVSYNTLANDLEGVNYSSLRGGLLDEREFYKEVQSWLKEDFLIPVFETWLEMFLLQSDVKLPIDKFNKFNKPKWTGRRWKQVDPKKEADANILSLKNGLKTKQMILSEEGYDYEETMEQLAYEKEFEKNLGLTFGEENGSNGNTGEAQGDDETDQEPDN